MENGKSNTINSVEFITLAQTWLFLSTVFFPIKMFHCVYILWENISECR